ncbi:MAG: hypothetical protein ACLFSM_05510 [Thermoplasmata archaeon]
MVNEEKSEEFNLSITLDGDEFIIEKKFLSLGNQYYIRDEGGKKVGFCEEKSLRIKGELRVYDSEKKDRELFRVKQENITNFNGVFKVIDKKDEGTLGYLERKSPESMMLSDWSLMDADEKKIGRAVEDSLLKEIIRFKVFGKVPYRYKLIQNGSKVGFYKQRINPFKDVYRLQIEEKLEPDIDRRILISLGLLLDALEGKYRKIKRVLSGF